MTAEPAPASMVWRSRMSRITSSRRFATTSMSVSNEVAKDATASSWSFCVTSARSTPAWASAASVARASSSPSVSVIFGVAWSRAEVYVAGGTVFTVSAPMRASTYITSGYSGFFVPVDAQSCRCGRAPAAFKAANRSPWKRSR